MAFSTDLATIGEDVPPLSRLEQMLDPQWIEEALAATGTASLRQRRLPAQQVLWLVIGMAMYRGRAISEVVASLDLALPGGTKTTVASSAIAQARQRVGEAPLKWLMERTGREWAHRYAAQQLWNGLRLYAIDGTTLRLDDSEENREAFPGKTGPSGAMSHPLARVVALLALDARLIAAARVGPFSTGEQTLATELWNEVPADSLVIVDRLFNDAAMLINLARRDNRHWLMLARKSTRFTSQRVLGPGDELVEMKVSSGAQLRDSTLPKTYVVRAITYKHGSKERTLLTSLLDPDTYPAAEITRIYSSRWEIENAYDEVKTEMLEREETLRSRKPEGVRQEIWGILLAYNLVRLEIAEIAREAKVEPLRISFVTAFNLIRNEWMWCSVASPGAIPRHLHRLREEVARYVLPPRRDRSYPRVVKSRGLKYQRKNVSPVK